MNFFSKITPTRDKCDLRKDIFQGSKIPLKYARILKTAFCTVLKIDFRPLNMPETFFLWSQVVQGTPEDNFGEKNGNRNFAEKSTFWTCFAFLDFRPPKKSSLLEPVEICKNRKFWNLLGCNFHKCASIYANGRSKMFSWVIAFIWDTFKPFLKFAARVRAKTRKKVGNF